MKKVIVLGLSLFLFFSFAIGSAFAQSKLEKTAEDLIGIKYKWAGTTKSGFDCSGFTSYVFDQLGFNLPHSSKAQSQEGDKVAKSELRAGDLVFFDTGGSGISHVGIYLGDGVFIHSSTDDGVIKSKLSESYYAKRYITASRILDDKSYDRLTAESK
ncbi:C40 family peptidase [Paenibacillus eucommiae]|uniref:Cell wall-associated NlpC family hydrolase n=1 Tax=Paenibacillus eucommiae TaxID=1355755 RepID=A0ABS4J550_9BACL|nr:C40 family peptidase [Paenibacillus eucommiae]MBP1994955.1 cell wall-associated NlpC family hydrolase [Paenibacillus eucommiae]